MSWISRFANGFRSSAVDRALDDEIRFHIESRIEELVDMGMSREMAETMARRQFGNPLHVREMSRDVKLMPSVENLLRDVHHGLRTLRRSPVFTRRDPHARARHRRECGPFLHREWRSPATARVPTSRGADVPEHTVAGAGVPTVLGVGTGIYSNFNASIILSPRSARSEPVNQICSWASAPCGSTRRALTCLS